MDVLGQGPVTAILGEGSNAVVWPNGPREDEDEEELDEVERFNNLRLMRIGMCITIVHSMSGSLSSHIARQATPQPTFHFKTQTPTQTTNPTATRTLTQTPCTPSPEFPPLPPPLPPTLITLTPTSPPPPFTPSKPQQPTANSKPKSSSRSIGRLLRDIVWTMRLWN